MIDFSSSLYLGMKDASATPRQWSPAVFQRRSGHQLVAPSGDGFALTKYGVIMHVYSVRKNGCAILTFWQTWGMPDDYNATLRQAD